jgi:raffinose/stachyose/melibiose transport system permease protein
VITSRLERTATYAILVVFTVVALVPVLEIVSTAFSSQQSLQAGLSLPDGLHWHNFVAAWDRGHFGSYLRSSVIVALSVVVAAGVLSTLAAYAFGTMRFPGSTVLFYLFLLGLTIPEEALVIPLYYDFRGLGLTDTYWALILPQTAQSVAFGTFWMRSYFSTSSRSLIDAARMDGASSWSTLWRVLVPAGRPAITTMVVITFMWTWNEFLLALVMVTSDNRRTVPLGLAFFQGQHSSDLSLLAAAAVLVALPVVLVYLVFQRRFIEGMLTGAVKE